MLPLSSTDIDLPQGVYEPGSVVIDRKIQKFTFIVAENSGGFASLRGEQVLMRDLVVMIDQNKKWRPIRLEGSNIVVNGTVIGECGEVDTCIREFDLNVPISGAQFDMQSISQVTKDSVL